MKKKLHPAYYQTKVVCACGNTFIVGSTLSETIKVEVCSHCHPFYTGKQKLIDSTGRVDKFKRRTQIAKDIQNKEKQAPLVLPDSIPEMAPVSIKKRASTATEAPGKGKNTVTHKKIANKLVIKKQVKNAPSTVAKKSSHPVSKGKTSVGKKVLSKKIAVKKKMKK